jgi:hypothetical protein
MSFPILYAQNSTPDRRSMLFSRDKNSGKKSKKSKKIQSGRRDAVGGGFVTRTLAQGWCGGCLERG